MCLHCWRVARSGLAVTTARASAPSAPAPPRSPQHSSAVQGWASHRQFPRATGTARHSAVAGSTCGGPGTRASWAWAAVGMHPSRSTWTSVLRPACWPWAAGTRWQPLSREFGPSAGVASACWVRATSRTTGRLCAWRGSRGRPAACTAWFPARCTAELWLGASARCWSGAAASWAAWASARRPTPCGRRRCPGSVVWTA
mmetsp:Transcript_13980/g.38757  ORF Transcript_13980/g.38757 Transcript_13980/m.38757 type:complete len:200 (-) Transcript_13980:256-855(-)